MKTTMLYEKNRNSMPWKLDELYVPPKTYPAVELDEGDLRAVYLEGPAYVGRPTRVFAYYAEPDTSDGPVPAVVLVHGGGGSAFKDWVRLWTDRGYAAIAVDLEGHVPLPAEKEGKKWASHPWSGPERQGEFEDYKLPVDQQWMYHAVAAVITAHSYIRSLEGVDGSRTGIAGISWGGIVTGIVSGVDDRFAFGVAVYGCGFLYEAANRYGEGFARMEEPYRSGMIRLWDPSSYLGRNKLPMLWVTWNDDPHFPLHLFSRSCELSGADNVPHAMSIQFGLGHSHAAGWKPAEIYAFADWLAFGAKPLVRPANQLLGENGAVIFWKGETEPVKAELCYTLDVGNWFEVEWRFAAAELIPGGKQARAAVPAGTAAYFFQLTDERGLTVSSPIRPTA